MGEDLNAPSTFYIVGSTLSFRRYNTTIILEIFLTCNAGVIVCIGQSCGGVFGLIIQVKISVHKVDILSASFRVSTRSAKKIP